MKKLLSCLLIAASLITSASAVSVYVDSKELKTDVPAQIVDGRTMVPLAPIFEALGASVSWDQETKTATGAKDETTVSIQIGSNTAYVDGKPKELDVSAMIIGDRTMVPAAFISQALGAQVLWSAEEQKVQIITDNYVEASESMYKPTTETEDMQWMPVKESGVIMSSIKSEAGFDNWLMKTNRGYAVISNGWDYDGFYDLKVGESVTVGGAFLASSEDGTMISLSYKKIIPPEQPVEEEPKEVEAPVKTRPSRTVFITPTGSKYHYSGSCNGGHYIPSTLNEAKDLGLEPCSKCVK